nr:hypothetical protein GCM10025730_21650 [Promicromonospora thailandica]
MSATMRAVVVDHAGGPEVLRVRHVPVPLPAPGWVRIRVAAFGLNRSELHFRQGLAYSGSFPGYPASRRWAWSTRTRAAGSPRAPRSRR